MKVFLSSTYIDLIEYRKSATEALEKLGQQVDRMEIFNANPSEPSEVALNELKQCNLFIGIYAHRYGTIPKGKTLSITELEYNYAKELDLPRFCYIVNEDYPWNPKMIEKGKQTKLKNLKKKIKDDLTIEFISSPKDLAFKIATSVGKYISNESNNLEVRKKSGPSNKKLKTIKDFERKYRNQVGNISRLITIPHFDESLRIHINQIFVSPSFIPSSKKREVILEKLEFLDFLNLINRTVVIGDPGAGKSTLAQKICYELFDKYENKMIKNKLLTPVLIVLRDYSLKKKEKGYSITEFIESEVTSKYQLPKPSLDDTFEILFKNGDLIMIFDGLDELLDYSHRREITQDIESFSNLYPKVPVLITSRVVGYEQTPLDPEVFETFLIAPFDENQVKEYINKWFENKNVSCRGDPEKNKEAFLKESEIAIDLRSNPLMLALMCNLYRGVGFIPRNRPELYKKCSEMLFERWDPSRGIWVQLPISEPKALLSRLAFWIYSDETLQSGTTESHLIRESKNFLFPRRFETEEEAEKASNEFIRYCRGRAWVFTDVGTTPDGQILYNFTHKTFLEYFAAVNIIRTHNSPEKLWKLLKRKIAKRSWDVVAQLCFQMMHENVEDASNKLLEYLIKEARKNPENSWPYLSFGARCLQFIQPSPNYIRVLTSECIKNIIEGFSQIQTFDQKDTSDEHDVKVKNEDLLTALTCACQECRNTISSSIKIDIKEYINQGDEEKAIKATLLGLGLVIGLYRTRLIPDLVSYWKEIQDQIFNENRTKIMELATKDYFIFKSTIIYQKPDNLINHITRSFSINHLFHSLRHLLFNVFYSSYASTILGWYFEMYGDLIEGENQKTNREYFLNQARFFGKFIINQTLPCFSIKNISMPRFMFSPFLKKVKTKSKTDSDLFFGIWGILAVFTERFSGRQHKHRLVRMFKKLKSPFKELFGKRLNKFHSIKLQNVLKKYDLHMEQEILIKKWINGKIDLVD